MKISKAKLNPLWGLFLILTAACGAQTPSPTPTPLPINPSAQATPTQTSTPSPTNIPTPITPPKTLTPATNLSPEQQVLAQPVDAFKPLPETVNEMEGSILPPGFSITKYADIFHPMAVTFDNQGNMLASSPDGSVRLAIDEDHDGRADIIQVFAEDLPFPLGIAVHPETGDVYVSHQGIITILQDTDNDRVADTRRDLVTGLPFENHQNNNISFGPDGLLYVGIGSTCDACIQEDPRSAAIMRFDVTTGQGEVFASGLRNAFDHAFHPLTGDLFATDNGQSTLGVDNPWDELNHVKEGQNYGFPECWDDLQGPNCENTIPAIGFFEAHSSVNGIEFYTGGNFPEEYQLNLFVTVWGTLLNIHRYTGIQRIILTPDGDTYTTQISWFALFPEDVRPLPIAQGPDGALYFGNYWSDGIYRISYGTP